MKYSIDNPPDIIVNLPDEKKAIWIKAFNAGYEQDGDEARAAEAAWAAVKQAEVNRAMGIDEKTFEKHNKGGE